MNIEPKGGETEDPKGSGEGAEGSARRSQYVMPALAW
jgi:hypothetical protein